MRLAAWLWVTGLCALLGSVGCNAAWAGTPSSDAGTRHAWQLHLQFNAGTLSMWQLRLEQEESPAEPVGHYRELLMAGQSVDRKGVLVKTGDAGNRARFDGGWTLRRGEHALRFASPSIRLLEASQSVLLFDDRGRAVLSGEMPHRHTRNDRLDWRNMNLRMLPEGARALGEPAMADQVVGGMHLSGPTQPAPKGNQFCRHTVLWPSPTAPADIALIDISGVFAQRCNGCGFSSTTGRVVIAPNAELLNVGASDVVWRPKFAAPAPPYDNDQHPYLVWALYRIDPDGSLHPLGSSAVKHAFFAQNDMCACAGDTVLYRGCSDLYSAFTNDDPEHLGPRSEIAPRSALWGRCGSVFDGNCDGLQNNAGFATDGYQGRLAALESDLLPASNPGATYWLEAWYVVREDSALDNSFAHRQIIPSKVGSAWVFPLQGATVSGPLVHRWVDPQAGSSTARSRRVDVSDGRLQLAVRVDTLPDTRFRYRYALMNLDFAEAVFSGAEPAFLRLVQQRGARSLRLDIDAGSVSDAQWRDDDGDAGNDWAILAGADLRAEAPDNEGLGWGQLGVLEFTSSRPPEQGQLFLGLGAGQSVLVSSLLPAPVGRVFRDGLEAL